MGLMRSGPDSAAAASASTDQSSHARSSVRTSSRTLLSTSVPGVIASVGAGQGHDLVGAQSDITSSAETISDLAASRGALEPLPHDDRVAVALEVDLRSGA